MAEMFSTGRIVDLIIVLMVFETAILMIYRKLTSKGLRAAPLLTNMAAGACLMVALRGALVGSDWSLIAAALAGSLVMHVVDLQMRWKNEGQSSKP